MEGYSACEGGFFEMGVLPDTKGEEGEILEGYGVWGRGTCYNFSNDFAYGSG